MIEREKLGFLLVTPHITTCFITLVLGEQVSIQSWWDEEDWQGQVQDGGTQKLWSIFNPQWSAHFQEDDRSGDFIIHLNILG